MNPLRGVGAFIRVIVMSASSWKPARWSKRFRLGFSAAKNRVACTSGRSGQAAGSMKRIVAGTNPLSSRASSARLGCSTAFGVLPSRASATTSTVSGPVSATTRSLPSAHQAATALPFGPFTTTTDLVPFFTGWLLVVAPASVPIKRLTVGRCSRAAAARMTRAACTGLSPLALIVTPAANPRCASILMRTTPSVPVILLAGAIASPLSMSCAAINSSMTPSFVSLSSLYAAVFFQASAWLSRPSHSR